MGEPRKKRKQQVYTLLVQLGRSPEDGLPAKSVGAGLLCFSSGVDEEEAVREAVNVLKVSGLSPLDVTGYGTLQDREELGHEIGEEERDLMERALQENAVIIAEMTPFFEDPKK